MKSALELLDVINEKYKRSVSERYDSLEDWLHEVGNASDALLYSTLFMPKLALLADSVLLAWGLPDDISKKRFLGSVADGSMPLSEIEASFNFTEIGYLFNPSGRNTSDQEDMLLAQLIRDAWDGWLKVSYPDRCFAVEVLSEDVTGSTVGLHFYEVR